VRAKYPHFQAQAWTGVALAAAFVVVALASSFALIRPGERLSDLIATVLPIIAPNAQLADHAFARGDLDAATARSQAELAVTPLAQDAWLRLAMVDLSRHGRLTLPGVTAIDHAYDTLPYDLNPNSTRLRFVLNHFGALPPGVQASVRAELAVWANRPALRRSLQRFRPGVNDPQGARALSVTLEAQLVPADDFGA